MKSISPNLANIGQKFMKESKPSFKNSKKFKKPTLKFGGKV